MNINRIFVFAAAMLITVGAFAQEQQGRIKPVRLGVSVTVGSNAYAGISALPPAWHAGFIRNPGPVHQLDGQGPGFRC